MKKKKKKDKFCSYHHNKKYDLLKKLHSNVVTEEGTLELRNLVSQLISLLLPMTRAIAGPEKKL